MKIELAKWGNSAAVRIPKKILEELKLSIGDAFDLSREDGCICLMPLKSEHRKVAPAKHISYSNLFTGYEYCDAKDAWPDDDMPGAEGEAWR